MRLQEKIPNLWRCAFFNSAATVTASRQNAYRYDEVVSGLIIYAYVGGNPISMVDPKGTFFFIPALIAAAASTEGAAVIIGSSAVLTGAAIWMANNLPPGFWPGNKGAEEWGRQNDVGAKGGRDIFHDIKRGNRSKPGSRAADNCSVNPDTGEVRDGNGDHIGDLGDGH
jgi:hypothetical protein